MKLEDFGLKELQNYVDAETKLDSLEEQHQEERDVVYNSCYPSYGVDAAGDLTTARSSVEDAVIMLDELDESYKSLIRKYKERSDVLRRAISHLADDERFVFERKFFEKKSLNGDGHILLDKAVFKVCTFIQEQRNQKKKQEQINQQADLRQQVRNWKLSQKGAG